MTAPRNIAQAGRPEIVAVINGSELPRDVQIIGADIHQELNRIATARLLVADGTAAAETFAQSAGQHFVPGNEVEIKLGASGETTSVFKGVVVKQRITHNGRAGVLEVTCKHKAFRMTASEKFAVYEESTDSEIAEQLAGNYSIQLTASTTAVTHPHAIQYKCTDWDFLVNRAESNSMVVLCADDELHMFKPDLGADEALEVLFGATVLAFEAELDGRLQEPELTGYNWNYDNQVADDNEADNGNMDTVGNLSAEDLASGLNVNEEQSHYSSINRQEELKAITDAEQFRRRLSKVRARVTTVGSVSCKPGDLIKLAGFGDRFNGKILVSGVGHKFTQGTWKTTYQLGLNPVSHLELFKPMPKSTYLIPRSQGLEVGLIKQLEADPDGSFRARVTFPSLKDNVGLWARVAQPDAGDNRGVFFRPEIEDEVIVGFINDDPRMPVVLGAVHSAAKPAPIDPEDDNHKKGIVTRSGIKLLFNDDLCEVLIETPAGNSIRLSDDEGVIEINDENGNKIKLSSNGLDVETPGDFNVKATGDVNIEGVNITLTGSAQAKIDSSAGTEVSSSATTTVKGAIVQIN